VSNMNVFLIASGIVLAAANTEMNWDDYDYFARVDTNMICRWSGTSPVCRGGCEDFETDKMETNMLSESYTAIERKRFGLPCLFGIKKLCCLNKYPKDANTSALPLYGHLPDDFLDSPATSF
ncbi:hypothetical protein PENTCL1PPCAC_28002, partial [Pristionchus entomophagus]